MDRPRRPVPWAVAVVYGAVLAGGVYWSLIGGGQVRLGDLTGFALVFALLFAVEAVEWRRPPSRATAAGLLAVRVGLFAAAALLDGSGTSRALFVLVPFVAYFAFGRATSIALAAACLALIVTGFTVSTPDWPRDAEYVSDLLMFTIGLVLAVCMAAVASAERDARTRLAATLDRVAELSAAMERNRVARDIHDSLGHHLTAIAIQLEKATAFADRDPALAARAVEDARGSARDALADVRRSVHALREQKEPFSLRDALGALARDAGEPAVTVTVTGEPDRYDAAALTALYRAAQEGLTNARRHAGASSVTVSAAFDDAGARLVVADDGRGFAAPGEGFGLLGMRERVELVGGEVRVDSGPGAGTVVTVTIPHAPAWSSA
ncbi:sensor histidine kinase [Phytohabitans houttuyneae]|uniref:histidine kinase n=1 Tax=Phytohabitans houttuyneae TaxID=1076126 RepID=A0A6V8KQS2_9ACTN|nr:sensor histidine kinase [Phytohabitans houttuyneae]GFJ84127.1 two-component sensor histidine kinase [Phytohabitans houttuyneae]